MRREGAWSERIPIWVPSAVTLLLGVAGSWLPSFWLDEASTIVAADRPVGEILDLSGTIDRVHVLYYLLVHGWLEVFGTSELALRLPSALAMAVATGGAVAVGRSMGSRALGVRAGLVLALLPIVSHHAMDARPFPFALAAVTWAGWALARALMEVEGGRAAGRWWALWALLSAVATLFSLYSVFVAAAQVVTALLSRSARRDRGFFLALGALLAVVVPWSLAVFEQRGQMASQAGTFPASVPKIPLWLVTGWFYEPKVVSAGAAAVLVLVLGGVALRGLHPADHRAPGTSVPALAVPWLVVPPAAAVTVSAAITPTLQARYLLGTVPALALLVAAGWPRLSRTTARAAAVPLLLAGLVLHVQARGESSREDLRGLAQRISAEARPGDAVLFTPQDRVRVAAAYPDAWEGLRDIGHVGTAAEVDRLTPAAVPGREIVRGAGDLRRVWVVGFGPGVDLAGARLAADGQVGLLGREPVQTWEGPGWVLVLTEPR